MRSVERLLGSAKHFPIEVTLSSGDRHVIRHPDHTTLHPKTGDLIIHPDEGEFVLAINPAHITQIRPLRGESSAAWAMNAELKALLTNPEVFPVELTLTSGDKVLISHLEYVHVSGKLGKIFYYPEESGGGVFEMITPEQIARVRAKWKRSAA